MGYSSEDFCFAVNNIIVYLMHPNFKSSPLILLMIHDEHHRVILLILQLLKVWVLH